MAFANPNLLLVNDLAQEIEFLLPESPVSTTMGTAVGVLGPATVAPPQVAGIYVGVQLLAGSGPNLEVITVTAFDGTNVTATFAQTHAASDPLVGAAFWAGQTLEPLLTQAEVLGYFAEVQNDFLLRTRSVYAVAPVPVVVGVSAYPQPADAIRIERVALDGNDLFDEERFNLDGLSDTSTTETNAFYRDKLGPGRFGIGPAAPQVGGTLEVVYSQRGPTSVALDSQLLVPDPLAYLVKWGVAARVFAKDGEIRDPRRAQYAQKRYDDGCQFVQRLVDGLERRDVFAQAVMEPLLGGR